MKRVWLTIIIILCVSSFLQSQSKKELYPEFFGEKENSHTSINYENVLTLVGDTLYTFQIQGNRTNAIYNLGLAVVGDTVIISSGGYSDSEISDNMFYRYTLEGTFIDSIPQNNITSGLGYRDMAFDGTNIYASDGPFIKKLNPSTLSINKIFNNSSHTLHKGMAYDNGFIYSTYGGRYNLFKIDAVTGETVKNCGNTRVSTYGIAADACNDSTKTSLWYSEPATYGTFRLTRVDIETGIVNIIFDLTSIFPYASSGGLDIINNHPLYPGRVIAVMLVQMNPDKVAFIDITDAEYGTPKPPSSIVAKKIDNKREVLLYWLDPIKDINGNPTTIDSILIVLGQDHRATIAPGVQTFIDHYPRSGMYRYKLSAVKDGRISKEVESNIVAPTAAFFEDFSDGLSKWNITNNGICPWEIKDGNNYQLPSNSTGNCLAADVDECGSGNLISSIATTDSIDTRFVMNLTLEFDSDWRKLSSDNFGYVEISSNGTDWETMLVYNDENVREEHVSIDLWQYVGINRYIQIRFRAEMPEWDWHWAIDNIYVDGWLYVTEPGALIATAHQHPNPHVNLTWQKISHHEEGFEIFRKNNDPINPSEFVLIGTTGHNELEFTDTTVQALTSYSYKVRTVGISGYLYSYFSNTATVSTPIPVELTSFTAKDSEEGVLLNWTTATETNNSGYHIERSNDSKEFTTVAFVEGRGTTTETSSYSYVDRTVSTGKYFYRIKQIDFDGSYEYSNTLEVEYDIVKEYGLEQNFPNPFNPTTQINYQLPESGVVELKVYDALGNMVATLVEEHKEAGKHKVEFFAGNLSSGVYFYRVSVNNFSKTYKMMLMK